jgi:hypothetical protein
MPPPRFRFWHVMALVAVMALISGVYVWLLPPELRSSPSTVIVWHDFYVTMHIAGYDFPHTSPMFWVIVGVEIVVLAGLIAVIVQAWKAFRRRIALNGSGKGSESEKGVRNR